MVTPLKSTKLSLSSVNLRSPKLSKTSNILNNTINININNNSNISIHKAKHTLK